jgi:hypothetical protein
VDAESSSDIDMAVSASVIACVIARLWAHTCGAFTCIFAPDVEVDGGE